MSKSPKHGADSVARSRAALDKSRNEQQKAVLLKELSAIKHQADFSKLCEESARIIQKSKDLCALARTLVEAKNDLRKKGEELRGQAKKKLRAGRNKAKKSS